MKALRNYLDKIKPNFEEGGKIPRIPVCVRRIRNIPVRPQHDFEIGNAYSRRYRQQAHYVDGGHCVGTGVAVRYV